MLSRDIIHFWYLRRRCSWKPLLSNKTIENMSSISGFLFDIDRRIHCRNANAKTAPKSSHVGNGHRGRGDTQIRRSPPGKENCLFICPSEVILQAKVAVIGYFGLKYKVNKLGWRSLADQDEISTTGNITNWAIQLLLCSPLSQFAPTLCFWGLPVISFSGQS